MARRAMGDWAARHGRLLRQVGRRHPLVTRPPAGTVLPEALGVRPQRLGRRFHLGRMLPPAPDVMEHQAAPPPEAAMEPVTPSEAAAARPAAPPARHGPVVEAVVSAGAPAGAAISAPESPSFPARVAAVLKRGADRVRKVLAPPAAPAAARAEALPGATAPIRSPIGPAPVPAVASESPAIRHAAEAPAGQAEASPPTIQPRVAPAAVLGVTVERPTPPARHGAPVAPPAQAARSRPPFVPPAEATRHETRAPSTPTQAASASPALPAESAAPATAVPPRGEAEPAPPSSAAPDPALALPPAIPSTPRAPRAAPAAPQPIGLVTPVEERQARRLPPPGRVSARDRGRPAPPPAGSPEAKIAAEVAGLFQPATEKRGPQDWLERLRAAAAPSPEAAAPAAAEPAAPAVPTGAPVAPAIPRSHTPRATAGPEAGHPRGGPSLPGRAIDRPVERPFVPARQPGIPPVPIRSPTPIPARLAVDPVAPAARRFLTPLLGIDPGEVEVVRGPEAEVIARAHDADAVTHGETVVIGEAAPERSPEGLGLLAHELTHVARQRDPRFVPPVVAAPAVADADPADAPRAAPYVPARPPHERPAGDPEEGVAERVEAAVRGLADTRGAGGPADNPVVVAPGRGTSTARAPWGELPAPWEPLPDFAGDGDDAGEDSGDEALVASTPVPAPPPAAAPAEGGVQRAARGRRVEEDESSGGGGGGGGQAAPDVEALARQVYGILKRRIAAERRRGA